MIRRSPLAPVPTLGCVLAASVLAGCGGTSEEPADEGGSPGFAADPGVGHVHALGVDPADDTLYVAGHYGLFRVTDEQAERVADRQQDTMGFAVVGEGHFLGSGHPDPREELPPSLGLVESTDAGESWEPLSLLGEADLHSIEPAGELTYAYDSTSQSLLVTEDRQRWDVIAQLLPVVDLAVDPAAPDTVWVTVPDGRLLRSVRGAEPSPVYDAPPLGVVEWEAGGPMGGVGPQGQVMVSRDGESGWDEVGRLDGPVQALDVTPGRWHAATDSGIHESTDGGATWDVVLDLEG